MLRHPIYTLSAAWLAEACPGSHVLPWSPEIPSDKLQPRDRGLALHRFVEQADREGRAAALDEVPIDAPWRRLAERLDLSALPPGDPEVGVELDLVGGAARVISSGSHRAYDVVRPGAVAGTLDRMHLGPAEATVCDFKFGRVEVEVEDNLQVGGGAVAAAAITGAEHVAIYILQPTPDDEWDAKGAQLGPGEIRDMRERHAQIRQSVIDAEIQRVATGRPPLRPGPHCKLCKAAPACPEFNTGVADVVALTHRVAAQPDGAGAMVQALAPVEVGRMWAYLDGLEDEHIPRLRAALRERIERERSIPAFGHAGKVLARRHHPRAVALPEAVDGMLTRWFGADLAARATWERATSWSTISRELTAARGRKVKGRWWVKRSDGKEMPLAEVKQALKRGGGFKPGGYWAIEPCEPAEVDTPVDDGGDE